MLRACPARSYVSCSKPSIVFFDENLPREFFACAEQDFAPGNCDLLVVMGTSLQVGWRTRCPQQRAYGVLGMGMRCRFLFAGTAHCPWGFAL
jgi:NAD-dependent SIR2 family protein deacetylase